VLGMEILHEDFLDFMYSLFIESMCINSLKLDCLRPYSTYDQPDCWSIQYDIDGLSRYGSRISIDLDNYGQDKMLETVVLDFCMLDSMKKNIVHTKYGVLEIDNTMVNDTPFMEDLVSTANKIIRDVKVREKGV
jgi:hypothetical protein